MKAMSSCDVTVASAYPPAAQSSACPVLPLTTRYAMTKIRTLDADPIVLRETRLRRQRSPLAEAQRAAYKGLSQWTWMTNSVNNRAIISAFSICFRL
jgi:hypothetical protein